MKNIAYVVIGIFVGLIGAGLIYITLRTPQAQPVRLLPSATPEPIVVYVTGAVKRPGVYRLPADSRVVDVMEQAGGFLDGAEIAQLNLAERLVDGQQIEVLGSVEFATPALTIGGGGLLFTPTPPAGEPLNINSATVDQLDELPGIGPTAAQKIVEYREANGPFNSLDELLKVPGIGPATLDEIRGLITLG